MSSFQTYIGSAFSSHPVRWIESPEAARSRSVFNQTAEKPIEKAVDPDAGKPKSESGDVLDISTESQKILETKQSDAQPALEKSDVSAERSTLESTKDSPAGEELTPEEQQQVEELKARDREVRIHEMAHVMAGGAYVTSGPSYTYQTGPDGNGYAIGGSVGIDTSPVEGDPKATIQKMQTVAAAALAPAEPSGQDLKVAAAARQAAAKAQAELSVRQTGTSPTEKEESVSEFSIVRSADRADSSATSSSAASGMKDAEKSSVLGQPLVSAFAPGVAYKAQSTASLASSRFSAFA